MSDIQVWLKDDPIPLYIVCAHREFQRRFNMFKSNTFVSWNCLENFINRLSDAFDIELAFSL